MVEEKPSNKDCFDFIMHLVSTIVTGNRVLLAC